MVEQVKRQGDARGVRDEVEHFTGRGRKCTRRGQLSDRHITRWRSIGDYCHTSYSTRKRERERNRKIMIIMITTRAPFAGQKLTREIETCASILWQTHAHKTIKHRLPTANVIWIFNGWKFSESTNFICLLLLY